MAELRPIPFGRLVSRMFRELEERRSIFDLPARRIVLGSGSRDLSVRLHGKRASTALGPAAGPQSQLAQNLVLSFLGGGRIFELKTVQLQDRLRIPRPCIDLRGPGYNVEWSQELRLEESLEEYVKGSMLVRMLAESGALPFAEGFCDPIFDMSVGYDLAGIQSERVGAFLRGLRDARPLLDRLRREIPAEHAWLRDLDYEACVSDTLTLSTFHGCPSDEIERICRYLLEAHGLHVIVKLNPTLLGAAEARRVLNERLGWTDRIPDEAFAKDSRWEEALAFCERLEARARELGRGFGVKATNTLIVENPGDFLPASEKVRYLSGPPLHVLAMQLVARLREAFGHRLPLSFSGGIDRVNFPDALALGLCPVTVCTDLLRPQGYGRMQGYFAELERRMAAVGARDLAEWSRSAYGTVEGASVEEAQLQNARRYAAALLDDPRYRPGGGARPPKKIGRRLELLDCVTCDLCVPVCPNDANFTFALPRTEIAVVKLAPAAAGGWARREEGVLRLRERHQIGSFADACNECGNCDVFCPEDGGPYLLKPRLFGSLAGWREQARLDGFFVERREGRDFAHGRSGGREYLLEAGPDGARYAGPGFELELSPEGAEVRAGHAAGEVDLTYFQLLRLVSRALLHGPEVTWVGPREAGGDFDPARPTSA